MLTHDAAGLGVRVAFTGVAELASTYRNTRLWVMPAGGDQQANLSGAIDRSVFTGNFYGAYMHGIAAMAVTGSVMLQVSWFKLTRRTTGVCGAGLPTGSMAR